MGKVQSYAIIIRKLDLFLKREEKKDVTMNLEARRWSIRLKFSMGCQYRIIKNNHFPHSDYKTCSSLNLSKNGLQLFKVQKFYGVKIQLKNDILFIDIYSISCFNVPNCSGSIRVLEILHSYSYVPITPIEPPRYPYNSLITLAIAWFGCGGWAGIQSSIA